MDHNYAEWTPPQFFPSHPPYQENQFSLTADSTFAGNFARFAKWSPDGSTILAQCENRSFEMFDLPDTTKNRVFRQSSSIIDFAWYPTATKQSAASYCFVASVRESPVKLLDASDGRLRASYRIVDHRERQIAPHALAFNSGGDRLYCGFENAIEVFDVGRPGEGIRLHTTPSKKSQDGLKGIISALAFPSYGSQGCYAAGTLTPASSNIALFSEDQGETPISFLGGGPVAGVTQLKFNPLQPHLLYAAYRRHDTIYCWDIRGYVGQPTAVYEYDRPNTERTNQKRKFDIDICGKWLGVGDEIGSIHMFSLDDTPNEKFESEPYTFPLAHEDAIGSVSFNPIRPILLSVSGSRHFLPAELDSDSDSDANEQDSESVVIKRSKVEPVPMDASLKIWNFGDQ